MNENHSRQPSLAVLIDADNASPRFISAIFEEVAKIGEATVRRIYGDFSGNQLGCWDKHVQSLAILQQQQRNNTIGKNAADIALVIDAMDLMYKENLDGFCLISSDSDFTRLAQRLRENRLEVYGFGERKTPESFRSACNRFIYVENLEDEPGPQEAPAARTSSGNNDAATSRASAERQDKARVAPVKKDPPSKAVPILLKAIRTTQELDDNQWISLSRVGSLVRQLAPDFDSRTYGHANLSSLVKATRVFEVRTESNMMHIRPKTPKGQTLSAIFP